MRFIEKENESGATYKCVSCGSENVRILREDATNPRCKCNGCGFTFNGADSLAAGEAGAIPDSSSDALAGAEEPERESVDVVADVWDQAGADWRRQGIIPSERTGPQPGYRVPRSPSYVFIAKDGAGVEFCTKKNVKQIALKWAQGKPFNAYELSPKKFEVNLDIS